MVGSAFDAGSCTGSQALMMQSLLGYLTRQITCTCLPIITLYHNSRLENTVVSIKLLSLSLLDVVFLLIIKQNNHWWDGYLVVGLGLFTSPSTVSDSYFISDLFLISFHPANV